MSDPKPMSASEFKRWQAATGLNVTDASKALGLSRATIYAYLSNTTTIPRTVQLACDALLTKRVPSDPPLKPLLGERDLLDEYIAPVLSRGR